MHLRGGRKPRRSENKRAVQLEIYGAWTEQAPVSPIESDRVSVFTSPTTARHMADPYRTYGPRKSLLHITLLKRIHNRLNKILHDSNLLIFIDYLTFSMRSLLRFIFNNIYRVRTDFSFVRNSLSVFRNGEYKTFRDLEWDAKCNIREILKILYVLISIIHF